ncbi:carcinoembryonic antigen-related cell adhesion molecule 15-like isoform X2 [Stegostoma tigrinum]|uniref:carcinoembryonic antigen-related cell adhesion molecule 15-like isoform X2 n=1 Tax=Stegostoma tigrinum TaxID=3053191 RepID=UPI00202B6BD5|nr:carcinoembryonic antigen-related cell adhesion molecule 15-like isoform X2 [Stegostoma tigrinum]
MERARLTTLAVCSLLSVVDSEALTISVSERLIHAAVGNPVILSVRPSEKVRSGTWKHNGSDVLAWIGETSDINILYSGRVEFLHSNNSLLLKSVTASDSGEYSVTMNAFTGHSAEAAMSLLVIEPISSVSITSDVSEAVKENDTVILTCHVLGSWTEITWIFNECLVNSNGKIKLSSENATLMIINVHTSHIGIYKCIARSLVSEKESEPYFLTLDTFTQSDNGSCNEWKIAIVVLAVTSITELVAIAVLFFKIQKASRTQTGRYILQTVSGTMSSPTYENFMPSINDEKERGDQNQTNSPYTLQPRTCPPRE